MLINWIDKSVSWVRAFLERGFLIKTVLISTLVSVFLQVPSFPEIEALFPTRAILEISNSPWTQIHYDAGSHAEKKTLRPLVPLIANVLRLKHTWQVYFLFAVANAVLLFLIARLLERRHDALGDGDGADIKHRLEVPHSGGHTCRHDDRADLHNATSF